MSQPLPQRGTLPLRSDYPPAFPRRFLAPRFWPAWLGLGVLWLLSHLPDRARRRLGTWLGELTYRRHHKRRAIVLTNLAWCFPDMSTGERELIARDYFCYMAQSLLDYGLLWWGGSARLDRILALEGGEYLQEQLAAGKRVILLTCHNVALDFGATALTRRHASVGMVKAARNPLIDWVLARGRTRFKGILYRRDGGMRPVLRAIRAGYAFYYLPDEDLGPEASVFVPFFGVPTATITALSRLARVGGAVVLPYMTYFRPEDGRYVARISPALTDFPGEDEEEDAARMNRELEAMIRVAPEQYMWSLRIFQTRPDGAPPPYAMKGKPGSGHRPAP